MERWTARACGELWTVKLDGVQRHESFAANRLHAIEAPAPATTLEPFTPECLEEGLALDRISIYLHGYCSKPDQPTDLVRRTPETALWFAVLEERRSIDDLSDAEVDGLRYLLSAQRLVQRRHGLPGGGGEDEHWAPCARHWAWWGRLDVLDLCANTNNLLERFFGLLKYIHLERSTQHSLQRLINLLLERVVPASILRRRQALAGRGTSSDQRQYEQRLLKWIKKMVDDGDVTPEPAGSAPGLTSVRRGEGKPPHKTCVGDLSCSCSYNEDEVCTHLKAAAQVIGGFTPALRAATADYLLAGGQIQVDAAHRCSCLALAAPLRPVVFSPLEGECTCFDRALHGTCCHLLAAARLPQFEGMELPAGPPVPDANVAYNINIRRTFQLPASEPLGDDWGQAELQALVGAPQRCAAAIQQATGNADLEIAAARRAAAYAVSVADSLPEGEQRQAVLAALAEAQRLAEGAAASAKLPATAVRAGKIGRRLNSRGEELRADGQRRVRPLLNRAGSKRPPLVAEEGIFCGNEFKKRARKGKATDKVRGVIANEDGTTLRGGPHHRKGKGRRKGRKGRKA
ncbi:hypothetical protein ABPG75_010602 [Micractinium tetrahymenae]